MLQRNRLMERFSSIPMHWMDSFEQVADICGNSGSATVIVANEFFDALPVHLFRFNQNWKEVLIDAKDTGDDVHFRLISSQFPSPMLELMQRNPHPMNDRLQKPSTVKSTRYAEYSATSDAIYQLIAKLISRTGGLFLAVDYGQQEFDGSLTIRAIRKHQILSHFLDQAGQADLSADVDFHLMASRFQYPLFESIGPVSQGEFLTLLGIRERTKMLIDAHPELSDSLMQATNRLVEAMGQQYKVFSAVAI